MKRASYHYNRGEWRKLSDASDDKYAEVCEKAERLTTKQRRAMLRELGLILPLFAPEDEVKREFDRWLGRNNRRLIELITDLEVKDGTEVHSEA